jgi:hypothetical protein
MMAADPRRRFPGGEGLSCSRRLTPGSPAAPFRTVEALQAAQFWVISLLGTCTASRERSYFAEASLSTHPVPSEIQWKLTPLSFWPGHSGSLEPHFKSSTERAAEFAARTTSSQFLPMQIHLQMSDPLPKNCSAVVLSITRHAFAGLVTSWAMQFGGDR